MPPPSGMGDAASGRMTRLARFATIAVLATLTASSAARADDAAPAPTPAAPVDIAAFPPPGPVAPRDPGVELHGVVAAWWIPWSQDSPTAATDALRLRFAVLRIDARPAPGLSVIARLGLMLPGSPLLDLAATYQPHAAIGVTFGQFRLPIGASATTLAPQLTMMDRPGYVYAMTKLAFRDVGAMVHSGPAGLAEGLFHYRLAITNGSGRLGSGAERTPDRGMYLVAGRALVDVGRRWLGGSRDRLVAGATVVRSHDPAIDTGTPATDATLAAGTLGRTLAPIGFERVTVLAGGDLTFAHANVWVQAEALYLRSRAVDAPARRRALGASLEAAWQLPAQLVGHDVQLAARGERFDPDLDAADDARQAASLGVNLSLARLRWSVFGTLTRFDDATSSKPRHAGELAVRAVATF